MQTDKLSPTGEIALAVEPCLPRFNLFTQLPPPTQYSILLVRFCTSHFHTFLLTFCFGRHFITELGWFGFDK